MHVCHQRQLAFCELCRAAWDMFFGRILGKDQDAWSEAGGKGPGGGIWALALLAFPLLLIPFHPSISPTFALSVALWLLQTWSPPTSWWTRAVKSSCATLAWAASSSTPWPIPLWEHARTCRWVRPLSLPPPSQSCPCPCQKPSPCPVTQYGVRRQPLLARPSPAFLTLFRLFLIWLFPALTAGEAPGHSLFGAVGCVEHGPVTGRAGHRSLPHPPAWR